jgi:dolichyl-diphosphooligosaccharide---protein glycosyltransferase
MQKNLPE